MSDDTVVEFDQSHCYLDQTGCSGQFSFAGGLTSTAPATRIPAAPDPGIVGYGQPGAGLHLTTDLGSARILHNSGDGWHLTLGGLFEAANRSLQTINNNLATNSGNFTVQKNFGAVGLFTVGSDIALLNGPQRILGFDNDVVFGTASTASILARVPPPTPTTRSPRRIRRWTSGYAISSRSGTSR